MSKQGNSKVSGFGDGGMQIHIPAAVRKDSQNPIHMGDMVMVTIDGDRLIVQKISTITSVIIVNR
jgi:bifunctional DNA-binding transcriptional regulator/antitoxin component of YhaV-PrlF toxin-antitoxin module